MNQYDVIVIGGGAAGMLAAAEAAKRGLAVALLEKNDRLGIKLRITGKGRCNLTNNCPVREVVENTPTGGAFLYSALSAFSPQDVMRYFTALGVPLKTERGNRVFPVSDRARDVADALVRQLEETGVKVFYKTAAHDISLDENGAVRAVLTSKGAFPCRAAILCTGGLSYPRTGSTGDGLKIAEKLGHTVIPPRPSLVPLEASPEICGRMQGLALKNVAIKVYDGGKKPIYEDFGELLFTHFGVSGPLILSASAHTREFDRKKYSLSIDLKPALDEKELDERLLRDFEKYANRDFANALGDLLPRLMIPVIVDLSGIPPHQKVHSITRRQRQALLGLLKSFTLQVIGPRPIDEAVITSGGVATKEISPKTMESKLVPGLFFAGEVIDADAYTGGFNLQIAWSTAYAAASHILM
ncbi:MAG: NAD(P)/FAD-dependent oxidoreductase [Clostridiales bacterium]|nr:NAD(P)/FAD-dependent oxidoreductase [Clostridiales bacterium]